MMKVFNVCNTSSCWWVIAPDEEIAIKYSFRHTSTREERNLYILTTDIPSYIGKIIEWRQGELCECDNLHELLESNRVGIVVCIKTSSPPKCKCKFTCSHKWTPEEYI